MILFLKDLLIQMYEEYPSQLRNILLHVFWKKKIAFANASREDS